MPAPYAAKGLEYLIAHTERSVPASKPEEPREQGGVVSVAELDALFGE